MGAAPGVEHVGEHVIPCDVELAGRPEGNDVGAPIPPAPDGEVRVLAPTKISVSPKRFLKNNNSFNTWK